mmetsp:Transcript_90014/g.251661  ORF Transcript_90014/g.251661 Transcript_90014/m.251661 type:complete len:557 (-) Transcript_90014:290-1960(-)
MWSPARLKAAAWRRADAHVGLRLAALAVAEGPVGDDGATELRAVPPRVPDLVPHPRRPDVQHRLDEVPGARIASGRLVGEVQRQEGDARNTEEIRHRLDARAHPQHVVQVQHQALGRVPVDLSIALVGEHVTHPRRLLQEPRGSQGLAPQHAARNLHAHVVAVLCAPRRLRLQRGRLSRLRLGVLPEAAQDKGGHEDHVDGREDGASDRGHREGEGAETLEAVRDKQALRDQIRRRREGGEGAGDQQQVRQRQEEEGLGVADLGGPLVDDRNEAGHHARVRDAHFHDDGGYEEAQHGDGQQPGAPQQHPKHNVDDARLLDGMRDYPEPGDRQHDVVGERGPSVHLRENAAEGQEERGGHQHHVGRELPDQEDEDERRHPDHQVARGGQLRRRVPTRETRDGDGGEHERRLVHQPCRDIGLGPGRRAGFGLQLGRLKQRLAEIQGAQPLPRVRRRIGQPGAGGDGLAPLLHHLQQRQHRTQPRLGVRERQILDQADDLREQARGGLLIARVHHRSGALVVLHGDPPQGLGIILGEVAKLFDVLKQPGALALGVACGL